MFSPDSFKSAERERSLRQIVADAYTRLWDLFWLPIGFISKLLIQSKLFPSTLDTLARWRSFRTLARKDQRRPLHNLQRTRIVKPVVPLPLVNWTLIMKERSNTIHLTYSPL